MLELHKLIWVVPGVIFIHVYNKRRPAGSINLSGWSYIFSLVVVAVVIWMPVSNIINQSNIFETWKSLVTALASGFFAWLLARLFTSWEKLAKIIFLPVYDVFFTHCVNWEKKPVIIGLKNDKIYIGILLKYPENPRSRYESQMISIFPLRSGGRDQKTKEVEWGKTYPNSVKGDCEIIIPRSEIVTFGIFNENTFKHFYKQDQFLKQ